MIPFIEIVSILVLMLFAIPIIWYGKRSNYTKPIGVSQIVKTLNQSLKLHFIIGTILALMALIYSVTEIKIGGLIAGVIYTYLVVGVFMYLPALGLLNLINLLNKKKIK